MPVKKDVKKLATDACAIELRGKKSLSRRLYMVSKVFEDCMNLSEQEMISNVLWLTGVGCDDDDDVKYNNISTAPLHSTRC